MKEHALSASKISIITGRTKLPPSLMHTCSLNTPARLQYPYRILPRSLFQVIVRSLWIQCWWVVGHLSIPLVAGNSPYPARTEQHFIQAPDQLVNAALLQCGYLGCSPIFPSVSISALPLYFTGSSFSIFISGKQIRRAEYVASLVHCIYIIDLHLL